MQQVMAVLGVHLGTDFVAICDFGGGLRILFCSMFPSAYNFLTFMYYEAGFIDLLARLVCR